MASRFSFYSPWSRTAQGFKEELVGRELQRRQDEKDAIDREKHQIQREQEARLAARDKAAIAAMEDERMRRAKEDALQSVARAGVGGVIEGPEAQAAQQMIPGMVSVEGGTNTLPATTLPLTTMPIGGAGQGAPGVLPQVLESVNEGGTTISKGTPEQQILAELEANPDMTARDILIKMRKGGGEKISPGEARILAGETEAADKPEIGSFPDYVTRKYGPNPTADQIAQAREEYRLDPNAGGAAGNRYGYSTVVPTAEGVMGLVFDKETGQWNRERIGDNRLGETAQAQVSNAIVVGKLMDRIAKDFTPEKVGVLQGRLSNMNAKYWGSDPEYAELIGSVRTLQNTVIQLRTGAQMSVQEAKRILDELPDETTPPSTAVAKLNRSRDYYNEWLKTRTAVGFGRMTPGAVDKLTTEGFGTSNPLPTNTAGTPAESVTPPAGRPRIKSITPVAR